MKTIKPDNALDPGRLAANCLAICGIPANLGKLVKHLKVRAVKMDMPQEVSGMVVPDHRYGRFFTLAINGRKSYHHRRFTVAHELYHILCRTDSAALRLYLDQNAAEERQANIFATELLMPGQSVRQLYDGDCRSVGEYCKFFKVSKSAMKIRLFKELAFPEFE